MVAAATDTAAGETAGVRTGSAVGCVVGVWLSAAVLAWAGSHPGVHLVAGLVGAVVVAVTGVCWLVTLLTSITARRLGPAVAVTVLALVVAGAGVVAAGVELPLRARFALARPAFEQVIADRGEVGPQAPCPRVIGGYRVLSCRTVGSDTYFTDRDGGFLDRVGFVYLPEGVPTDPPTSTSISYTRLDGPWYWFVEAW